MGIAEKGPCYAAVERLLLVCFVLFSNGAGTVYGPSLAEGLTIQVVHRPS